MIHNTLDYALQSHQFNHNSNALSGTQIGSDKEKLEKLNDQLKKSCPTKDQYFFGHGKLLLTGEYLVLDGALALSLPTKFGQSLSVKYRPSYNPILYWKSFDEKNSIWFECRFEFWQFKILDDDKLLDEKALALQKIFKQVRKQNPHFLRDEVDVLVETKLGFPIHWGLGTSSTLINNIAQWAYVSPFELQFKTFGGSGYDIASAQSHGPILYKKESLTPQWTPVHFRPTFHEHLFFVYQEQKRNTRESINEIKHLRPFSQQCILEISELTQKILKASSLDEFEILQSTHEQYIGKILDRLPIQQAMFQDFSGVVKSLGAWGGDFLLVSSRFGEEYVRQYFQNKNMPIVIRYQDLILGNEESSKVAPYFAELQMPSSFIH